MTTLVDKVVAIEDALRRASVPHAFGGALALAFHVAEPRATRDIDVNCFVTSERARATFSALPREIAWSDTDVAEVVTTGRVRIFWDDTPVDLFFTNHAFHERAALHTEEVPFAGTTIPILGATELAVFKAFFDRTKDWADIEAMADVGALDLHVVIGWIVDLLGADDHRVARLRALLDREPPETEPRFLP
jgi:hypothetical protein